MTKPLSDDEIVRQAKEFYEAELRATLETTQPEAFVAIEPISRTYSVGQTLSEAGQKARRAFPERIAFGVRVGHNAAIHIGGLQR